MHRPSADHKLYARFLACSSLWFTLLVIKTVLCITVFLYLDIFFKWENSVCGSLMLKYQNILLKVDSLEPVRYVSTQTLSPLHLWRKATTTMREQRLLLEEGYHLFMNDGNNTLLLFQFLFCHFISSFFKGVGGESSRKTNRNENIMNPAERSHRRTYQMQLMLSQLAKWSQSWCVCDDGDYEAVMPFIACVCAETLTDNLEVIHGDGKGNLGWAAWKTPFTHSFGCFAAFIFIYRWRTQLQGSLGSLMVSEESFFCQ